MIHMWRDLPPGANAPREVSAVIEIPAKSRNKYELDKESGLLKLDRFDYKDIAQLPQHYLKEVEHFFHIYKDLEGRRAQIIGWEDSTAAAVVIAESIARYEARYLSVGP